MCQHVNLFLKDGAVYYKNIRQNQNYRHFHVKESEEENPTAVENK